MPRKTKRRYRRGPMGKNGKALEAASSGEESFGRGVVKSMGIVFGDIGTSPIYTLSVVFLLTPPTEANILGVLSLVFWTTTTLVTLQYVWLAMSLDRNGQVERLF